MTREYNSAGWTDSESKLASIYGVTVSTETPITGVYGINEVSPETLDDAIFYGDSIDLGWEDALEEFQAENGREPDDDETEEMSENYFGCGCDTGPHLIGSWKKNESGEWEPDQDGEFSAIVRDFVIQVVWSKTTGRAGHCSPCYPGQADMSSSGPFLAYTLPADWFDDIDG